MRRAGRRFPEDDRFELQPRFTSFRSVAPNPPQRATSGASAIVFLRSRARVPDLPLRWALPTPHSLHGYDSFHLGDLDDFLGGGAAVEDFELAVLEQALHSGGDGGLANLVGGSAVEGHVAKLRVPGQPFVDYHFGDFQIANFTD